MFLYHNWIQLPLGVRNLIASQFGITKTGPTHVDSNRVTSDGYDVADVEAKLNVDAIQAYTGIESTDMAVLWGAMIERVEGRAITVEEPILVVPEEVLEFAKEQSNGFAVTEDMPIKIKAIVDVKDWKNIVGSTGDASESISVPKKRGRPFKAK